MRASIRVAIGAMGLFYSYLALHSAQLGNPPGVAITGAGAVLFVLLALFPRPVGGVITGSAICSGYWHRPDGAWPLPHVYSEHGREVLEAAARDPLLAADVDEQVAWAAETFAERRDDYGTAGSAMERFLLISFLEGVATGTRDAITQPGAAVAGGATSYSWPRVRLAALCRFAIQQGLMRPDTGALVRRRFPGATAPR